MRNNIYLSLAFIIFVGCGNSREYSDVELTKLIKDMEWNSSYTNVKNSFEKKFGLEYDDEIKQKNNSSKVYIFRGGKINGVNTHSWVATFNNDSLDFVVIKIDSESYEENLNRFETLKAAITDLPYEKYSKIENEWILSENDQSICGISLSDNGKGISDSEHGMVMLLWSNKFVNRYAFM